MTLRWLEGFEGGRHETIAARLYDNVSGTFNQAGVAGPRGGSCAESSNLVLRTPELVTPDENTWVVGFAFRVTGGQLDSSPSARPYMALRNGSGEQLKLEIIDAPDTSKPGGAYYKLRVMRGATELARTVERFSGLASDLEWIYFQFKATVRTSTNGSFSLRYKTRKGAEATATWDAANTGVNTANQGADGADRIEKGWTTGSSDLVGFDDIYVLDSAGSVNNDFLGVLYIESLKPSGNGNSLQWVLAGGASSIEDALNETSNSQSVAEDDKRITSDTVGEISLATMTDLVDIISTTVVGVQVRIYGKMETTGTRSIQIIYRKTTGGATQTGGGILTLTTTAFDALADTRELDPNTGAAWTPTNINGIELGVELDS